MDNGVDMAESSKPTWEIMAESPIIEQVTSKYKLKLRYGGFFRLAKNSCRKIYSFGSQKCIYMETCSYNLNQLQDDIIRHYTSKSNPVFSTVFVDKYAPQQSFIELDSDENFMVMLSMYKEEKEVTIYVTTDNSIRTTEITKSGQDKAVEKDDEDESDYCPSEESYHSHLSSDSEDAMLNNDGETDSFSQKCPTIKVNSKFTNGVAFKRSLNHHAITNEYDYFIVKSDPTRFIARCKNMECDWRIHASIMQDEITFEVKTMVEAHSCTRSNKGGKCPRLDTGKDQWVHIDTGEKIYPPIIKRLPGRPRKNRIVSPNEPKQRRHKCPRCGQFGHREKTCTNPSSQGSDQYETSEAHTNKRRRGKKTKAQESAAVEG